MKKSIEELEALESGTLILSKQDHVFEKYNGNLWLGIGMWNDRMMTPEVHAICEGEWQIIEWKED